MASDERLSQAFWAGFHFADLDNVCLLHLHTEAHRRAQWRAGDGFTIAVSCHPIKLANWLGKKAEVTAHKKAVSSPPFLYRFPVKRVGGRLRNTMKKATEHGDAGTPRAQEPRGNNTYAGVTDSRSVAELQEAYETPQTTNEAWVWASTRAHGHILAQVSQ